MSTELRRFEERDIPAKIAWVNDFGNNRFLHYDLPLEQEKTREWYSRVKDRADRYDAVILENGGPVGLAGLLNIDRKNRKAEFYIMLGERSSKGKGVAARAGHKLLEHAFCKLGLNRVYLYTETENLPAQRLFERLGFAREGLLHEDLYHLDRFVDRYVYGIDRTRFLNSLGGYRLCQINDLYAEVAA